MEEAHATRRGKHGEPIAIGSLVTLIAACGNAKFLDRSVHDPQQDAAVIVPLHRASEERAVGRHGRRGRLWRRWRRWQTRQRRRRLAWTRRRRRRLAGWRRRHQGSPYRTTGFGKRSVCGQQAPWRTGEQSERALCVGVVHILMHKLSSQGEEQDVHTGAVDTRRHDKPQSVGNRDGIVCVRDDVGIRRCKELQRILVCEVDVQWSPIGGAVLVRNCSGVVTRRNDDFQATVGHNR